MKKIPFLQLLFACLIFTFIACSEDENTPEETPPVDNSTITVWNGPTITFTKDNLADPNEPESQDRITSSVWITRGNNGGQIYNAAQEDSADKEDSPVGTLWAVGTTAQIDDLTFRTFRATLPKPKDNVGDNLVMLLVSENIAIDVKITSWSRGTGLGGFSYERSTE